MADITVAFPEALLGARQVEAMLSVGRVGLIELRKADTTFPAPVAFPVGEAKKLRWRQSDLVAWIQKLEVGDANVA